jgi:hypothetical protein
MDTWEMYTFVSYRAGGNPAGFVTIQVDDLRV